MKEAVNTALNKGLLPESTIELIRQDLAVDVEETVEWLGRTFAGRELRWTEGVRDSLLADTDCFNFQTDEILARLVSTGVVAANKKGTPKTPIVLKFPAI